MPNSVRITVNTLKLAAQVIRHTCSRKSINNYYIFLPVVRFTSVTFMFELPVIKAGKDKFASITLMASIIPTDAVATVMSTSRSIGSDEMNRYTMCYYI